MRSAGDKVKNRFVRHVHAGVYEPPEPLVGRFFDERRYFITVEPSHSVAARIGNRRERDRYEVVRIQVRGNHRTEIDIAYRVSAHNQKHVVKHVFCGFYRARRAERLAERLKELTGLPVELWDERMTTVSAIGYLNATDVRGKRRKQVVDTVAATIILEDYLRHRKAQPTAEP